MFKAKPSHRYRYTCRAGHSVETQSLWEGLVPNKITCPVCQLDMDGVHHGFERDIQYYWFAPNRQQLRRQVRWMVREFGFMGQIKRKQLLDAYYDKCLRGELVLAPSIEAITMWLE